MTFLESAYQAAYRIVWAKKFGHEKIYKHCHGMARAVSTNTKYYFSGEDDIVNGLIGKALN